MSFTIAIIAWRCMLILFVGPQMHQFSKILREKKRTKSRTTLMQLVKDTKIAVTSHFWIFFLTFTKYVCVCVCNIHTHIHTYIHNITTKRFNFYSLLCTTWTTPCFLVCSSALGAYRV